MALNSGRRAVLKQALIVVAVALSGGAVFTLWRNRSDERRRMADRLGLRLTDERIEARDEPARRVARRWQRLLMQGTLEGLPATVWQRFWYLNPGDARPYQNASYCVLTLERTSPVPTQLIVEPLGLERTSPALVSEWLLLEPTSPELAQHVRLVSPEPGGLTELPSDLQTQLADFYARVACATNGRLRAGWEPNELGWFELEADRAAYVTLGAPDEACAERMMCALPIVAQLAQRALDRSSDMSTPLV